MALALDGNATPTNGSASSQTITLTTTNANDIIIMAGLTNGGPFTSVSSSNVLWHGTGYGVATTAVAAQGLEIWYGTALNPLSSEVITVVNTAAGFTTLSAFGISGANTATIFDSNAGSHPVNSNSTSLLSFTTSNVNDFIVAAYRFGSTGTPTGGGGLWNTIQGTNFLLVEYQIVSSVQSGLSATIGTGSGDQNASVGASIIQGTVGPTVVLMGAICM